VLNAYLEGSLQPEAGMKRHEGLTDEEECVRELLQAA
jgi:hypothetical protein